MKMLYQLSQAMKENEDNSHHGLRQCFQLLVSESSKHHIWAVKQKLKSKYMYSSYIHIDMSNQAIYKLII